MKFKCNLEDWSINYTNYRKTLPEGKYVVIDPSYVFQSDRVFPWEEYVNVCYPFPDVYVDPVYIVLTKLMPTGDKTFHIFTWSTRYGDGSYPVYQIANKTPLFYANVDSGCLSLIPTGRNYTRIYPRCKRRRSFSSKLSCQNKLKGEHYGS